MELRQIGLILNGVTGRMGTNQHLVRSILAIIKQGGVLVSENLSLMPVPILTGRNSEKLKALADQHNLSWTTDLDTALADKKNEIFFDASDTLHRAHFIERAVRAGKSIYCEKPSGSTTTEALHLATLCESAKLKNGVVQDKLFLPGLQKLQQLKNQHFFGKILSVRGEFGYWVFTGHEESQPPQRPSWNYRASDGGGIILDMFCHWRYVIENLFGPIKSLVAHGATDIQERLNETRQPYPATADDSAYAIFVLEDGTTCQFNSSWCTRVRRDDLLTIQVDGTNGSALAGLRDCWVQPLNQTPRPVWNPDIAQPINFYESWQKLPSQETENGFKTQWELFLRHVVLDEPFRWTLREGAKGVQLAELGVQSWKQKRWMDVPALQ